MLDTHLDISTISSYEAEDLQELAKRGGVAERFLKDRNKIELVELVCWLQDGKNKPAWLDEVERKSVAPVRQAPAPRLPGHKASAQKKARTSRTAAMLRVQHRAGLATSGVKKPVRPKYGVAARREAREEKLREKSKSIDEKRAENRHAKRKSRHRAKR